MRGGPSTSSNTSRGSAPRAWAISSTNELTANACWMLHTDRSHPMRTCAFASPFSARTLGIASGRSRMPCCSSPSSARADDGELQQGILDLPLAIPNVRAENGEAKAHVRIGWLRSVCNIQHAFAVNSFVDEIAQARGADPRDVLLEVLGPPRIVGAAELGVDKVPNYGASLDRHPIDVGRLRRVVERATELARWSDRRREGRSLGLAAHRK